MPQPMSGTTRKPMYVSHIGAYYHDRARWLRMADHYSQADWCQYRSHILYENAGESRRW